MDQQEKRPTGAGPIGRFVYQVTVCWPGDGSLHHTSRRIGIENMLTSPSMGVMKGIREQLGLIFAIEV
jgi:hypothetical protein